MSLIPQSFIDDLLDRTDIVEVIDSRVKLKKSGKNYLACCPFHKEKTPSFTVSQDKQFYYCFGCGASGTAITFLLQYEHLGFIDAVESLARGAGLQVPREEGRGPARSHKTLYEMLDRTATYYQRQLREHPSREQAVEYLKQRGLTGAVCKAFGVGFAPPGWDNLQVKFGLNEEDQRLLLDAGLVLINEDNGSRYDRFRQRIMFPIVDVRGRTIGFGGRVLNSKDKGPKYLNSPETQVFHKGRELYGLYQARQQPGQIQRLLVVEGYMDVIALAQFGLHNAVATLGTACGEDHLRLAFRYTSEVVFCFDGDNAGRKAARRALENSLPAMADGRQVKFLFLPEGQDPDTLVRQIGAERFTEQVRLAMPLEEFFFEAVAEGLDQRTMEGRATMSKRAAPLLHRLPAGVYRELMFDYLGRRTGLSAELLRELIDGEASLEQRPAGRSSGSDAQPINPGPGDERRSSAQASSEVPASRKPSGGRQQYEPPTDPAHDHGAMAPRDEWPPEQDYGLPVAPRRASLTRFSPVRIATALLLEFPELGARLRDWQVPEGDSEELERLRQLLVYLASRPDATFHSILGYWGGKFGLEQQQAMAALVAGQLLGALTRTAPFDAGKELLDACRRIDQQQQLQRFETELAELVAAPELTEAQHQRLKELLQLKTRARQLQHE